MRQFCHTLEILSPLSAASEWRQSGVPDSLHPVSDADGSMLLVDWLRGQDHQGQLSLQLARLLAATLRRPGERPAPRAARPGPRTPGFRDIRAKAAQPTGIGGLAPGAAPP
jgi:hypothetical protein